MRRKPLSRSAGKQIATFLSRHRRWLIPTGAGLFVIFIVLGILTGLPDPQPASLPAIAPATVEPRDMMGLLVAESSGVPLEAAGALCLAKDEPLADAAKALPGDGDAEAYLSASLSGDDLEEALTQAETLSWIGSIARNKGFPFAEEVNYGYSDGWGMDRDGGERSHEGIDMFAEHGTPILSVCDGVVEKKGWLKLGGWRMGIRGEDNIYYYYAHMSEYADFDVGDTVKVGDVIGYVGDSGYGPEGTTGMFVSHLHFGMYQGRDDTEKAFNPFPFLTLWDPKRSPDLDSVGKPDIT